MPEAADHANDPRGTGARAAVTLKPGDVLRVETPGGGGYGQP